MASEIAKGFYTVGQEVDKRTKQLKTVLLPRKSFAAEVFDLQTKNKQSQQQEVIQHSNTFYPFFNYDRK